MSNSRVLERESRGPVLIVRLNRPEASNALNLELMRAIGAAIVDAEADPDIRVVVLTATGDRSFCAGMDLSAFAAGKQMGLADDEATRGFSRLMEGRVGIPLVGAANGTAVAGGFELLLACDLVVASSRARFGLPEVKRGLIPGGVGTLLGTRVALALALEMTLTGDLIGAERAHDIGLVNAVVPPGEVVDSAVAVAERIAANAPLAVAAVKELVRLGIADEVRARERRRELRGVVFASVDAKEGALAFVEKRPPVWKGR